MIDIVQPLEVTQDQIQGLCTSLGVGFDKDNVSKNLDAIRGKLNEKTGAELGLNQEQAKLADQIKKGGMLKNGDVILRRGRAGNYKAESITESTPKHDRSGLSFGV